ncbi:phosphotransferase family protein [Paenibacillus sp. CF384]|uniref:phosphotransferase family protein n=1 Tax=Paenibacillus sp. CF384 TaxID=1884382 RepID=UPI00089A16F5|nr:aminoglycoside phosphotransferase family protein [Paenibacillus sp. CF384]SDW78852.1 TIGR02172 family protein [Paenibacillus sp. CF384]
MKIGKQVGRGNTADVYEWGEHEVIKLFHHAHEAPKEAKNAAIIARLAIRTPRFGGLMEYEGRSGIVYERINAPSMMSRIEPNRESVTHYAKMLAELQFQLHERKVDFTPNLKEELLKHTMAAAEISDRQRDHIIAVLRQLPDGQALCHYDFHPGNILMADDGPVIIDWMNVLIGDKAADVSRTLMMLASSSLPPDAPSWLREGRKLFHEVYRDEYIALSGVDAAELEAWKLPTLAVRIHEMAGKEQEEIIELLQDEWKE